MLLVTSVTVMADAKSRNCLLSLTEKDGAINTSHLRKPWKRRAYICCIKVIDDGAVRLGIAGLEFPP